MIKVSIMENDSKELAGFDISKGPGHGTRQRLLEAAGVLFAEKGFERTTAREICDLAKVNTAAVNYYFGGKRPLYIEVLREAHRRLLNFNSLKALAGDDRAPEEKIREYLTGVLHSMLDPSPAGWIVKVAMREMASPTEALNELIELQVRPTTKLGRAIMAELIGLPVEHEIVIRAALSTIGQLIFIFQNRHAIELLFPELDLQGEGIDEMAMHIWRYSVAGLRAVGRDAKQEAEK